MEELIAKMIRLYAQAHSGWLPPAVREEAARTYEALTRQTGLTLPPPGLDLLGARLWTDTVRSLESLHPVFDQGLEDPDGAVGAAAADERRHIVAYGEAHVALLITLAGAGGSSDLDQG